MHAWSLSLPRGKQGREHFYFLIVLLAAKHGTDHAAQRFKDVVAAHPILTDRLGRMRGHVQKTAHGEHIMIRNLLATTAIATLIATGAVAQTTTTPTPTDPAAPTGTQQEQMTVHAEGHLASNIIGESVYNSTSEDAENIGEVTDLVLSEDGNVEAIVVGVGGFLGIGQKEVALEYDLAEWSEQQDGERRVVVETSRDALEAQQEFDRAAYRPMPADADVAESKPATADDLAAAPAQEGNTGEGADDEIAMAPDEGDTGAQTDAGSDSVAVVPTQPDASGSDQTAAAPTEERLGGEGTDASQDMAATEQPDEQVGDQTAQQQDDPAQDQQTAQSDQQGAQGTDQTMTGAVDPSNMQEAQPDQIRAENLTGTAVYGSNDERIGEIGDVILTPEGDVDAAIVDVGGFLGIGEKEVALSMENLSFMTDENDELYLFTNFTQEELEAQPEYDEANYAERRDEMLLQSQ